MMTAPLIRLHIAWTTGRAHRRNDRGASLVEYALLASFIALACFATVTYLGGETGSSLDDSGQSIITAN